MTTSKCLKYFREIYGHWFTSYPAINCVSNTGLQLYNKMFSLFGNLRYSRMFDESSLMFEVSKNKLKSDRVRERKWGVVTKERDRRKEGERERPRPITS